VAVAQRLERYADVVGKENVIAGTDCGLQRVAHASIQWAKFRAMREGADIASKKLWGRN
jgi:5-methyltetrahydropteroyltriglutamate--homocysteine methyltransferase